MTKLTASLLVKHAEFIKAFAEDKKIQLRMSTTQDQREYWLDIDDPHFDRDDEGAYRIKPEIRTIWKIEVQEDNKFWLSESNHPSRAAAEAFAKEYFDEPCRIIEFVEKLT